jgi:hypothetical protein
MVALIISFTMKEFIILGLQMDNELDVESDRLGERPGSFPTYPFPAVLMN